MPPLVIVSLQLGIGKAKQFIPELIWLGMVARLIVHAYLIGRAVKNAEWDLTRG